MIRYDKINDLYNDIYFNDIKIGHVERLNKTTIALEISYQRMTLSYSNRKTVGTLAKKIYLRLEARKIREMEFNRKIKNSILRKEFKII